MAWKNYSYLRLVRGLTPPEFRVLCYLEDQADKFGRVEMLEGKSIAAEAELARNSTFRILRKLQDKQFIRSRESRTTPRGTQISNAYNLNLERYYPAGETAGVKIWAGIVAALGPSASHYAEGSDAYYSKKTFNLTVWLDVGKKGFEFFTIHNRRKIFALGNDHSPKIRFFDFLSKLPPKSEIF